MLNAFHFAIIVKFLISLTIVGAIGIPYYPFHEVNQAKMGTYSHRLSAYEHCLISLNNLSHSSFDQQNDCLSYSKELQDNNELFSLPRVCMVGYRYCNSSNIMIAEFAIPFFKNVFGEFL